MKKEILPSLLAADFGRLADEIVRAERSGADALHLDIMDGHFVPNITLGAPLVKCLRKCSDLVFDCHLMISDPLKYAEDFAKAGATVPIIGFGAKAPATQAEKEAQQIKGEGDKIATEIWNKATSVDPEFYAFYRTLEAYRNSFDEETSVVIAPEGEFFNYFGKSLK